MASESLTPPPSGGSAKYIVVLLLLLAGGLGVYLATSGKDEPKPTPPPEVKSVERPTALSNDTVEIPVEEEDAGLPPEEPAPEVKKPRVAAQDPWSCPGDIPVADIKKVLGEAQSSIRSCYERALRNNNQLQGSVALEVRVGSSGRVDNSRVRGNLRDPEVSKCIQNLTKNWRFPPPSGGNCAVVGAPYNFTPKN
jgi:TonB family protein